MVAERRGEVLHLHGLARGAGAGVDLLQADDVGVDLAQHGRDARGIAPAVAADALVDVVGGDAQSTGVGIDRHLLLAIRRLSHHSAAAEGAGDHRQHDQVRARAAAGAVAPIRSANTVSASTPGKRPIALPIR